MQLSLVPSETFPFLISTEHLLPTGKWQISGTGPLFIDTVCEAMHSGGLWLVMQDHKGKTAIRSGDRVSFAVITNIDWLGQSIGRHFSDSQIQVELDVHGWGNVIIKKQPRYPPRLAAQRRPLWAADKKLSPDDLLLSRLTELTIECNKIESLLPNIMLADTDPGWICLRWLELLPLPLDTKQRLLKMPDPELCLRYLKKIIQHSDLYSDLLR